MTWKPDYVTSSELKSYLRIEDTTDDVMVAIWVTTASRAVDNFCGRQFGQVASAEERVYSSVWDRSTRTWAYEIDDLQDLTGLGIVDCNDNAVTDYTLSPVNAILKGKPYERIYSSTRGELTITGLWGWSAVPTPVKNATLLQAARLAARRDSPYGVAGSPSDGSEIRLLASLDPDLRTSLGGYRRQWWAV